LFADSGGTPKAKSKNLRFAVWLFGGGAGHRNNFATRLDFLGEMMLYLDNKPTKGKRNGKVCGSM